MPDGQGKIGTGHVKQKDKFRHLIITLKSPLPRDSTLL